MTIVDVRQYCKSVQPPFVIFAGSYVSKMGEIAPTVPEIRAELLLQMRQKLVASGTDKVAIKISEYVSTALQNHAAIVAPGRAFKISAIKSSIDKIKFEEFIRKMASLHDEPDFMEDLIESIYKTPSGYFNYNHSAIAYLLKYGHCTCVLTTNFDTALENACHEIGYVPDVLTLTPASIRAKTALSKCIVKLHGCAIKREIIAESSQLISKEILQKLRFIRDVLDSNDCVTYGYSGGGDVDIAPQIRRSRSNRIFWGNRKGEKNPFPGSVTCELDLGGVDPHGRDGNFLLALASQHGWRPTQNKTGCTYKPILHKFLNDRCNAEYTLDAFLDLVGLYNGNVHAYYWYGRGKTNFIRNERHYVKDPRLLSIPLNFECRSEIAQYAFDPTYAETWTAFVDWRMAANEKALHRLQGVIRTADRNSAAGRYLLIRAAEIAIAIVAEGLWLRSGSWRRRYYNRCLHILRATDQLIQQSWWVREETVELKIKREARIAQIAFCMNGDRRTAIAKLSSLFDNAKDLELYEIVIRITQGAWLIDKKFGDHLFSQQNDATLPINGILAVRLKNFSHRYYNLTAAGRLQYFMIEKLLSSDNEHFDDASEAMLVAHRAARN